MTGSGVVDGRRWKLIVCSVGDSSSDDGDGRGGMMDGTGLRLLDDEREVVRDSGGRASAIGLEVR
mgnify:CR=1 FL=1